MTKFDEMEEQVFSQVTTLMGEDAVWYSSFGGESEGRVLFKYPTHAETIGNSGSGELDPIAPVVEWYRGTFTGLKESVDAQNREYLLLRGQSYFVESVRTKFDGDTYVANLTLSTA
jgi:hypothetical protein